jgi:hypothetical protein
MNLFSRHQTARITARFRGGFAVVCAAALLTWGSVVRPVSAGTEILVNDQFQIDQTRVNTCNGFEFLEVHGTMHRLEKVQPDGTHVFQLSTHWTGVSADGTEYVLLSQHKIRITDTTSQEVFHDRLISLGSEPNQHVELVITNPPFDFFFEVNCRG